MAMFSLWRAAILLLVNFIFKRPSPRQSTKQKSRSTHKYYAIKRISPFISQEKVSASMTVEAAIILPLFLFLFLNLGSAIELIRLHGNLELGMCDVGNRISVYGYAFTAEEQILSYLYAKSCLADYLGVDYLKESPLADGAASLQFIDSSILGKDGYFDLVVTYKVAPFVGIAGFHPFRMANRYYGHFWNGYQIPGTEEGEKEKKPIYVTETGTVYHESINCSHLALSIQETSYAEAQSGYNVNGEKYRRCNMCASMDCSGVVYITESGLGIHMTRDCSGLKRTVYAISREEAGKYPPCRRCAQ